MIQYLIVGQGLAGSILAWRLMQHEQRVLVVDSQRDNSASRVAAGLVNPIIGQRLVKPDDVDICLPVALDLYSNLQRVFEREFYFPMPMLRLFRSPADKDRYQQRCQEPGYQDWLGARFAAGQSSEPIDDRYGGFRQLQTGYLDVISLLTSLRDYFSQHGALIDDRFRYRDLDVTANGMRWKERAVERVIFCEGAQAIDNPWFRWLPFQLSKGEVIGVQAKTRLPRAIINGRHWLLPQGDNTAKIGATYAWQWADETRTEDAQQQLLESGYEIMGTADGLQVVEHKAGIRPTTRDKQPFIGAHPDHARLHIFNGFGSRGVVTIPYYADCFLRFLFTTELLPRHADIARFASGDSLVTLNKRCLSERIQAGDSVIDATVGNGYDTEFLARCVGRQGHVFGFDVQVSAIETTKQRLIGHHLAAQVSLTHAGHQQMRLHIPEHYHGRISAVVFNLGYLPGSDKSIVTESHTTLLALQQGLDMLKPGGLLSITCYRGHAVGAQETENVNQWLCSLDTRHYQIPRQERRDRVDAPLLVLVEKGRS